MEKLINLPHLMRFRSIFISLLIFSATSSIFIASAQEEEFKRVLIPLGSDHPVTLSGFINTAQTRTHDNNLKILLLPIGYASDPNTISSSERSKDLNQAGAFRSQVDQACRENTPEGTICNVFLAPILTRYDATENALRYFTDDLSAILILDGDHIIARQVIGGTPMEQALDEAYQNGVIVAGSGDTGNLLSLTMMGGYNQGFSEPTALNFGSADVWNDAEKHGLLFGTQDAIIDQNFFIENRIGRLLNAITLPNSPRVGIGIDANAGLNIINGTQLEAIFGNNPITILDTETYHAAQTIRYNGPANTLSLRNVLIHLIAPGWSYNLDSKKASLAPPPTRVSRSFDDLSLPQGAGPLIVSGDLSESLENNPILERFVKMTKSHTGDILIVPIGYSSEQDAETASRLYADALGAPSHTYVPTRDAGVSINLPDQLSGILIIGADQSEVQIEALSALKDVWLAGIPVLADNAGAAIIGESYSAFGPTPTQKINRENAIQVSFLPENSAIKPGLGFLDVSFEPKLISDSRWSQLISLAYRRPEILSIGLTDKTAIEVARKGPIIRGDNVAIVLDLRDASLELGDNGRLVIGNGFLDVFSLGDRIQPIDADILSEPDQAPTPELPTATLVGYIIITPTFSPSPSPTVEPTVGPTPTKTPKPTTTPLTIPPPSDPGTSNLMVLFGILIGVVILIGIGLNYRRIFPK